MEQTNHFETYCCASSCLINADVVLHSECREFHGCFLVTIKYYSKLINIKKREVKKKKKTFTVDIFFVVVAILYDLLRP